jgi:hypothetical protein
MLLSMPKTAQMEKMEICCFYSSKDTLLALDIPVQSRRLHRGEMFCRKSTFQLYHRKCSSYQVPISRLNQPFGLIDASTTIKEVHFKCAITTTLQLLQRPYSFLEMRHYHSNSIQLQVVPFSPWPSQRTICQQEKPLFCSHGGILRLTLDAIEHLLKGLIPFWSGKCDFFHAQSKGHLSQRLFCLDCWRCVSLDKQSKETFIEGFMSWQPVVRFALG